jgi:polyribonucleotide nucleotidyltransferase
VSSAAQASRCLVDLIGVAAAGRVVRDLILNKKQRLDGRKPDDLRAERDEAIV